MGKKQLVILDIPINGFCYSYAKALVEKLKELQKENKTFALCENGNKYTPAITQAVITALGEQVSFDNLHGNGYEYIEQDVVDEFIEMAEEFLSIFEKK